MTLYAESAADQTDHFAETFVREKGCMAMTFCRRYDIRKLTLYAILFREI